MKNVFVKLTLLINERSIVPEKFPKWINMSRCQEIDVPAACSDEGRPVETGAILTMNIPECFVNVVETPEQILALLDLANQEPPAR